MTQQNHQRLGKTLWAIADQLRGAMNADDFRDYMLAFLFLRYLSGNYEAAARRELGRDYPKLPADDTLAPGRRNWASGVQGVGMVADGMSPIFVADTTTSEHSN